jgi:hypothetical protein
MLQSGRSWVRFPIRSLDFSIYLIGPGVDSASNRSTRNLHGGKGWPELKANNLTAICEPTV